MNTLATIREFKTPNFSVVVDAIHDDYLDLSWDETGEVAADIEAGELTPFCARVRVLYHETELASDYLGGCLYKSFDDFMDHKEVGKYQRELITSGSAGICGSYFADMIKAAIAEARQELRRLQSVRVR